MTRTRRVLTGRPARAAVVVLMTGICLTAAGLAAPSLAATSAAAGQLARHCRPGARTLAPTGARLYPDTGNGGYLSVHTAIHVVYDATSNKFLRGTHVVLTDRAIQCLTSFSLDFERTSANTAAGPDMAVSTVLVNGQPAGFSFMQPTYPGDPKGPTDPNPAAHEASQFNPVGGPLHNPLHPACTPELMTTAPSKQTSLDGTQCPANKLVITPSRPLRAGIRLHRDRLLRRQAGPAQRWRRDHRGLVQVCRRRLRHHRACRQRGLDAAERLSERQADV